MSFDSDKLLVQRDDGKLMHFLQSVKKTFPTQMFEYMIIFFVLMVLGVLIWGAVEISNRANLVCDNATIKDDGDFSILLNRSLEPYNGTPINTLSGSVDAAKSDCKGNEACSFFTYDHDSNTAIQYTNGILPVQYSDVALIGPTQKNQDVYIKKNTDFIEMRGAFEDVQVA
jgi:hypothetical protein